MAAAARLRLRLPRHPRGAPRADPAPAAVRDVERQGHRGRRPGVADQRVGPHVRRRVDDAGAETAGARVLVGQPAAGVRAVDVRRQRRHPPRLLRAAHGETPDGVGSLPKPPGDLYLLLREMAEGRYAGSTACSASCTPPAAPVRSSCATSGRAPTRPRWTPSSPRCPPSAPTCGRWRSRPRGDRSRWSRSRRGRRRRDRVGPMSTRVAHLDLQDCDAGAAAVRAADLLHTSQDLELLLVVDSAAAVVRHRAAFEALDASRQVSKLLCLVTGFTAAPGADPEVLRLPGNIQRRTLWVIEQTGVDWPLRAAARARRRDGRDGDGLGLLADLLRLPAVFERTHRLLAEVPFGAAVPGLHLAGDGDSGQKDFLLALRTAIRRTLDPASPAPAKREDARPESRVPVRFSTGSELRRVRRGGARRHRGTGDRGRTARHRRAAAGAARRRGGAGAGTGSPRCGTGSPTCSKPSRTVTGSPTTGRPRSPPAGSNRRPRSRSSRSRSATRCTPGWETACTGACRCHGSTTTCAPRRRRWTAAADTPGGCAPRAPATCSAGCAPRGRWSRRSRGCRWPARSPRRAPDCPRSVSPAGLVMALLWTALVALTVLRGPAAYSATIPARSASTRSPRSAARSAAVSRATPGCRPPRGPPRWPWRSWARSPSSRSRGGPARSAGATRRDSTAPNRPCRTCGDCSPRRSPTGRG